MCIDDTGPGPGRTDSSRPLSGGSSPTPAPCDDVLEVRRWLQGGGHNASDVSEQVARRILSGGHLFESPGPPASH